MRRYIQFAALVCASWMWAGTVSATTLAASALVSIDSVSEQDYFGQNTAACDVNADGYEDLVIGSYNLTTGGIHKGGLQLLYGSATTVTSSTTSHLVTYSGEQEYDWLGQSVACGDINADGYDDIFVGAFNYDEAGHSNTGAIYLLYGQAAALSGGSISTAVKFANTTDNEAVGYEVNVVGDQDEDGYNDFMIGVPSNDDYLTNGGVVYFVRGQAAAFTSSTISSVADSIWRGQLSGDYFGSRTENIGDINNDGHTDIAVGAFGVDAPNSNSGAIYLYYGTGAVPATMTSDSLVQLAGELTEDQVGYEIEGVGDMDADGYDDVVLASFGYGATNTGAVYVIYGRSSQLSDGSLSQFPVLTGEASDDYLGTAVSKVGDLNQDGYADVIVGSVYADPVGVSSGKVYLVSGSATRITTASIGVAASDSFTGPAATSLFGDDIVGVDLNGDQYPELALAATQHSTTVAYVGTIYLAYLRIDLDEDGTLGTDGLFATGTDCNDNDASVVTDQTYYQDNDGDGLGTTADTVVQCVGTAPDGYADNTDDTDDTIVNNGIEISGDNVDNDGDGTIDEVNTVAENGRHPGYKDLNPMRQSSVDAAIHSVRSTQAGKLRVKYNDDSVYVYDIFSQPNGKLNIKRYPKTTYYVIMDHRGKKVTAINGLTGQRRIAVTQVSNDTFKQHYLQFSDVRNNNRQDLIVASKSGQQVRLLVMEVNLTKRKFKYREQSTVSLGDVKLQRTTVIGNTIDLRSSTVPLLTYFVTKQHQLQQL